MKNPISIFMLGIATGALCALIAFPFADWLEKKIFGDLDQPHNTGGEIANLDSKKRGEGDYPGKN